MATTLSTDVAGALSLYLAQPLSTSINRGSVLLHLLENVSGTGKNISWTVEFSGQSNASAVAETATYVPSDGAAELEKLAYLNWAKYERFASVSGLAEATAAATPNPPGAASLVGPQISLLAKRARDSYSRVVRGIAQDLYGGQSGQTPEEVTGIAEAIDSTGTYANLAQGTYSEWASTEATVAATSLSFDAIRTNLITPIHTASGEYPSMIMAHPTEFDKLRALYGSNGAPYIREVELATAGGMRSVKLSAGMRAFLIDDIPVFSDRDCTSGTIYAINTAHMHLEQLRPAYYGLSNEDIRAQLALLSAAANDLTDDQIEAIASAIRNPVGILPKFKLLGATGDQENVLCTAYANLVVSRRNAHGKLSFT